MTTCAPALAELLLSPLDRARTACFVWASRHGYLELAAAALFFVRGRGPLDATHPAASTRA